MAPATEPILAPYSSGPLRFAIIDGEPAVYSIKTAAARKWATAKLMDWLPVDFEV